MSLLQERLFALTERMKDRLVDEDCPMCKALELDGCLACDETGRLVTPSSWRQALTFAEGELRIQRDKRTQMLVILTVLTRDKEHYDLIRQEFARNEPRLVRKHGAPPDEWFEQRMDEYEGWYIQDVRKGVFEGIDDEITDEEIKEATIDALSRSVKELDISITVGEKWLAEGKEMAAALSNVRTEAKRIARDRERTERVEKEPTEERLTKAAGKMCYKANCKKTSNLIHDLATGHAWCRKHAPKKLRRG